MIYQIPFSLIRWSVFETRGSVLKPVSKHGGSVLKLGSKHWGNVLKLGSEHGGSVLTLECFEPITPALLVIFSITGYLTYNM